MTPKTAYLRLLSLAACNDLDLVAEELANRDLTDYDLAADFQRLNHLHEFHRFGVPLFPSVLPSVVRHVDELARHRELTLKWGPQLTKLLKGPHENE